MYYRRKILLALIEEFGGDVGKIDLQKLLFIYTQYQAKPTFDFIPHRFGCFSFQARWDLRTLITYKFINETQNTWILNKREQYKNLLTQSDKDHLSYLKRNYFSKSTEELIRETYVSHPYYAIRSEILDRVLNPAQIASVQAQIPERTNTSLYTIGYEGISIEKYFNRLIINDIKVLCDVRKNAFSQKVGFSKAELKTVCDVLNIEYVHLPELGIDSQKRQHLDTQKDYNNLFAEYRNSYLPKKKGVIRGVFELLVQKKRIALTCFEASHCQCHRGQVANAITSLPEWKYNLIHL